MAAAMTKRKSLFSDSNKQNSDSAVTRENVPSGSREDPNLAKPTQRSSKGPSQMPVAASKAPERELRPPISQANFNKKLMLILKDLHTEVTNQNEKVESQNVHIVIKLTHFVPMRMMNS